MQVIKPFRLQFLMLQQMNSLMRDTRDTIYTKKIVPNDVVYFLTTNLYGIIPL